MFGSKINPSGAAADLGAEIANSIRFNDNDSPNLTFTPSGAATSTRIRSHSFWIKRCNLSTTQGILSGEASVSDFEAIFLNSSNQLEYQVQINGGSSYGMRSVMLFRDPTAWYHCLIVIDTTESVSTDRQKMFVNGAQVSTTLIYTGALPLNADLETLDQSTPLTIGEFSGGYLDAYLADFVTVDGQALTTTDFGRYSTTHTNVWVPITYVGTYGNNGFHLDFAVAPGTGNGAGTDTSGNGNHFTDNNLAANDQSSDTPTNVFATASPINKGTESVTFSEGNTKLVGVGNNSDNSSVAGTIAMTTGKYYWEQKFTGAQTSGVQALGCGIFNTDNERVDQVHWQTSTNKLNFYTNDNRIEDLSGTPTFYVSSIAEQASATVGFAVDFDNGWAWVHLNGTYINGVPTFSDGTNAIQSSIPSGTWLPFWFQDGGTTSKTWEINFGTTPAGAGGNADDNGYGDFDYAPPSGFLALCQANLPSVVDDLGGADKPSESVQLITASGDNIVSDLDAALASGSFLKIYKNIDTGSTAWKWVFPDDTGNMWDSSVNTGKTTYSAPSGSDTFAGIGIKIDTSVGTASSEVSHTSGSSTNYAHGLGVTPAFVILFPNLTANKRVFHSALDSGKLVRLDDQQAQATDSSFTVDATNVTISSSLASGDYRILAFAQIDGFSSFKFHDSNSNANGPFLYHGFSPLFEITVDIDLTDNALDWDLFSYKLESHSGNVLNLKIALNEQNAKSASGYSGVLDHVATGSKTRTSGSVYNTSSRHHARVAFAQAAIGGGIPFPNSR